MNSGICNAIMNCFNLEELDLTGDVNIQDDGILHLTKGEIRDESGQ